MSRAGTIDLSTTDPEAVIAIDALMERLRIAQILLRSAEDDFDDAARTQRLVLEHAKEAERKVRDELFAAMESHGVPTVKDGSNTAVVVQRHDYVIDDERRLRESLFIDFGPDGTEEFRTWDMTKLKKFASENRRTRGYDYAGIASVPKRYLQVTQKTSEG